MFYSSFGLGRIRSWEYRYLCRKPPNFYAKQEHVCFYLCSALRNSDRHYKPKAPNFSTQTGAQVSLSNSAPSTT